jgi:hypothetical protein
MAYSLCRDRFRDVARPAFRDMKKEPNQPSEPTRGLGLRFRTERVRSTGPFHSKKTACAEPRVAHL